MAYFTKYFIVPQCLKWSLSPGVSCSLLHVDVPPNATVPFPNKYYRQSSTYNLLLSNMALWPAAAYEVPGWAHLISKVQLRWQSVGQQKPRNARSICIWDWAWGSCGFLGWQEVLLYHAAGTSSAWASCYTAASGLLAASVPLHVKKVLYSSWGTAALRYAAGAFWGTAALSHAVWTFQGMETVHDAYEPGWDQLRLPGAAAALCYAVAQGPLAISEPQCTKKPLSHSVFFPRPPCACASCTLFPGLPELVPHYDTAPAHKQLVPGLPKPPQAPCTPHTFHGTPFTSHLMRLASGVMTAAGTTRIVIVKHCSHMVLCFTTASLSDRNCGSSYGHKSRSNWLLRVDCC